MNDTPTPRTDAAEWIDNMCNPSHVVESRFSRTLERELTAAREEVDILKSKYHLAQKALQFLNQNAMSMASPSDPC